MSNGQIAIVSKLNKSKSIIILHIADINKRHNDHFWLKNKVTLLCLQWVNRNKQKSNIPSLGGNEVKGAMISST